MVPSTQLPMLAECSPSTRSSMASLTWKLLAWCGPQDTSGPTCLVMTAQCLLTTFTDHTPLKAMLKAKHQSGKLARWATVISELNLDIRYRPGRKNLNADALSRSPVDTGADDLEPDTDHSVMQVAADGPPVVTVSKETDEISKLQSRDDELHLVRQYLKDGTLPSDQKRACKSLLQKDQFVLLDEVLYHINSSPQHHLRIAVPD